MLWDYTSLYLFICLLPCSLFQAPNRCTPTHCTPHIFLVTSDHNCVQSKDQLHCQPSRHTLTSSYCWISALYESQYRHRTKEEQIIIGTNKPKHACISVTSYIFQLIAIQTCAQKMNQYIYHKLVWLLISLPTKWTSRLVSSWNPKGPHIFAKAYYWLVNDKLVVWYKLP